MQNEANDFLVRLTEAVPSGEWDDQRPAVASDSELEQFALRAVPQGTVTEPCIYTCGPQCF